jgi:AraC family transcriptional activator of pobA
MPDDKFLLSEFKKAIRIHAKEKVIDLDDKFNHKFYFQVHRMEDVLKNTNRIFPPNRWSYYRIELIKQGAGDFITGMYKFTAIKNTLLIIPSRVIASSKNWTADAEGYFILFNIDFFLQNNFPVKYIEDKKILSSSVQPNIQLTDEKAAEIAGIFETIIKENENDGRLKDELITLKIIELLIASERFFSEELNFDENLPSINIIKKFVDLLDAEFLSERSVSFYAKKLKLHPNYLNALIKKHTGYTAKETIQNKLFLEAKYLLHSTDLSIKEITAKMGFTDPNYFTVFFKRFENLSPAGYRSSFI